MALIALARAARKREFHRAGHQERFRPAAFLSFMAVASSLPSAFVCSAVVAWSLAGPSASGYRVLAVAGLLMAASVICIAPIVLWAVRTPRNLNPLAMGMALVRVVVPRGLGEVEARRGDAPGRNDPCPCGSERKYKRCHGAPAGLARR
jgi:hypothetical protein